MNKKKKNMISEQAEISNSNLFLTLHIGSFEEDLNCYVHQGKLHLINSAGKERSASLYIPLQKQVLVLKKGSDIMKEISQINCDEFYDDDNNLYIVNRDNLVICDNAYGFKYIDEETLLIFVTKPEKFVIENSSVKEVKLDSSTFGFVIKNNKATNIKVWKEYNETYLFCLDHNIYIYVDKEFKILLGNVYLWNNDNSELVLYIFEEDKVSFYNSKLEILLSEYPSKREHKDNLLFVTNNYIVFYDNKRILIINRDGEICWDKTTSFCPQGISDIVLWEFRQSKSPGNLLLSDTWVGYGENGVCKHFASHKFDYGFDDYAIFKIDRCKHSTNIKGKPAMGVISLPQRKVLLPAIFDDVLIVEYDGLAKSTSNIDVQHEARSLFVVSIDGYLKPLYGCFDEKKPLFPIGKYDKIEAIHYIDKWKEKWYKTDEYGVEREFFSIHEEERFSGWLVLKKNVEIELAYHDKIAFSNSQINQYFHFTNNSLCLYVKVGALWGILSPDGWAIPPHYNWILRIYPDDVEEFRGSAKRFWSNLFFADGIIYRIGIKNDADTNENRIVAECVFDPKDQYQYSHTASNYFGTDYIYLDIKSGKNVIVRICANSFVSIIKEP